MGVHEPLSPLVLGVGALAHSVGEGLLPWALDGVDLGNDALEIGPGPGLTTDVLRTKVDKLTCLEIDPKLASKLEARMGDTNVTVVRGMRRRCRARMPNLAAPSA